MLVDDIGVLRLKVLHAKLFSANFCASLTSSAKKTWNIPLGIARIHDFLGSPMPERFGSRKHHSFVCLFKIEINLLQTSNYCWCMMSRAKSPGSIEESPSR